MVSKASKAQGSSQTQNLHSKKRNHQDPFTGRTRKEGDWKKSTNYETLEIDESMPYWQMRKETYHKEKG